MTRAICPGSFDPVTNGHLDIIGRTAALFEHVHVAILENPAKQPMFDLQERIDMLEEATRAWSNVSCEVFSGLVVAYAQERGARAIIRGLRAVSDFEYEFQMASMNSHLNTQVETVFMMTRQENAFISSSLIKEVASLGGKINDWVPEHVAARLQARWVEERGRPD